MPAPSGDAGGSEGGSAGGSEGVGGKCADDVSIAGTDVVDEPPLVGDGPDEAETL